MWRPYLKRKNVCVPHSGPAGPSPAVWTRCSELSQHALGGCERSHTHTDVSASDCHIQALERERKRYTQILQCNKSLCFSGMDTGSTAAVVPNDHHKMSGATTKSVFIFVNWNSTLVGLLWSGKQKIHFKREMRQRTGHSNTIRTQSMKSYDFGDFGYSHTFTLQ